MLNKCLSDASENPWETILINILVTHKKYFQQLTDHVKLEYLANHLD